MKKLFMIMLLGLLVTGCGTENQVSNNDQDKEVPESWQERWFQV